MADPANGGILPTSPDTTASNHTRELAAIMFSDVVGYTAIMGRDENEALRALDAHRELLRSLLPKYNGRMAGEIGDGTLTAFHSATDAVNCAREVQAALQDQPELKVRIGIHLGDVVFSNNTVLGDGVNIASRIHALAPPGGICVAHRRSPPERCRRLSSKLCHETMPNGDVTLVFIAIAQLYP
jgi:class 3 adenylate cyclase